MSCWAKYPIKRKLALLEACGAGQEANPIKQNVLLEAGMYSAGDGSCIACDKWKKISGDKSACEACVAGQEANPNQIACVACGKGEFSTAGTA